MSVPDPQPPPPRPRPRNPWEAKVVACSWTGLTTAFVAGWLVQVFPGLAGSSDALQAAVQAVLVTISVAVAGWVTRHTPRPPGAG